MWGKKTCPPPHSAQVDPTANQAVAQIGLFKNNAVIHADQHKLSPQLFNKAAIEVIQRLQKANFEAYIVGGGVRDMLLNKRPKDFDIATNARPEQVKRLFQRCFIIGRRFRLAHVYLHHETIEVATFRAGHEKAGKQHYGHSKEGMIIRDNVYGTLEEDAVRRDFTINSLYYDPTSNTIIDHTGGFADLQRKQLRVIGEASQRYREDPVRMLRAIRLASKLGLEIEAATRAPFAESATLLRQISPARLFEEVLKFFASGHALESFNALREYHYFAELFPATNKCLEKNETYLKLIQLALANTDTRINENKKILPAFLIAIFLWQPLRDKVRSYTNEKMPIATAVAKSIGEVLREQVQSVAITKRFNEVIRSILELQFAFNRRRPKYIYPTFENSHFRAAYDFLLLRQQAGEQVQDAVNWWTDFIAANTEQRREMVDKLANKTAKSKKRADEAGANPRYEQSTPGEP